MLVIKKELARFFLCGAGATSQFGVTCIHGRQYQELSLHWFFIYAEVHQCLTGCTAAARQVVRKWHSCKADGFSGNIENLYSLFHAIDRYK